MSPALEDHLRDALRAYTADLTAPPALATQIRHGAARRRTRARLAGTLAPLAVAALVAGVVVLLPRSTPYRPPTADAVATALGPDERAQLAAPTQGDLAGDTGFVAAAARVWAGSHRTSLNADRGIFDHPVGDPVVTWAGSTPAGPAAIVIQVFDLREHENVQLEREGPALLWGFVGPGAGGAPTVVADGYPVPGAPSVDAALLGPDRQVLLVADRGRPVEVSWGLTFSGDGRAKRVWTPVRFADGAAVVRVPAGTTGGAIALQVAGGYADVGNRGGDPYGQPADRRLPWLPSGGPQPVWPVGADPAAAWGGRVPSAPDAETALNAEIDRRVPTLWPDVGMSASSLWFVVGTTADGSRLVTGERQLDDNPSQAYVVVRHPDGRTEVASRPTDADGPVPVLVPVPGDQGWLLAAAGKSIAWTEGGTRHSARNAALVPAGGTGVTVDGAPVTLR